MKKLVTPPLPEVFCVDSSSLKAAETYLEEYYTKHKGNFNYLNATKCLQQAFKGFHNLDGLVAGCVNSGQKRGVKPNSDVIRLAGPVAFGRQTQVFQLPKRYFHFGRDRASSFRVPFFFVENKIINLMFLQPRKEGWLNKDQYGGLLAVYKQYLLDLEFYGSPCDIEVIDVAAPEKGCDRELDVFHLKDVSLWSAQDIQDHLTVTSEALEKLEKRGVGDLVKPRRPLRDAEFPLFD